MFGGTGRTHCGSLGPDDLHDLAGTAVRDRPPAGYARALVEDTGVLRAVDAWADAVLAGDGDEGVGAGG